MVICNACLIEFPDLEQFKIHFKTEFHRHNLKRKAVNLQPITLENFQERVIESKAESNASKANVMCEVCNKQFSSRKQLNNHNNSQKHKDGLRRAYSKSENRKQDNQQVICKPEQRCLFCAEASEGLQQNLEHMSIKHSFFIPDIEEVKDLILMIKYLNTKIYVGKACTYCNFQGTSIQAVQQHMRDKGHCFLGESSEYIQFYEEIQKRPEDLPSDWVDLGQETSEVGSIVSSSVGTIVIFGNTEVGALCPTGELKFNDKVVGHREYKNIYKQRYKKVQEELQIAIKNNMAVLYSKLGLQQKSENFQEQKLTFEGMKQKEEEKTKIQISNNKLHIIRDQSTLF